MSLRAALLLLLASEPMTGYDAARQFGTSVGHLWRAPDSQIYPELRQMESEGLVVGSDVPWGGRGATKRQYAITDAGVAHLDRWAGEPMRYRRERDPARLRAGYFEWSSRAAAQEHLQAHRAHYIGEQEIALAAIAAIRERDHQILSARLDHYDPAEHERIAGWKVFAHEGRVARAAAEIAWAERGLELLATTAEQPADYHRRPG